VFLHLFTGGEEERPPQIFPRKETGGGFFLHSEEGRRGRGGRIPSEEEESNLLQVNSLKRKGVKRREPMSNRSGKEVGRESGEEGPFAGLSAQKEGRSAGGKLILGGYGEERVRRSPS